MEELSFSTNIGTGSESLGQVYNPATPLSDGTENFSKSSFFSWNYYKKYFNVSTEDIISRAKMCCDPRDKKFLQSQNESELYGAIWSLITSLFLCMVIGNISSMISLGNAWNRSISHIITASTLCFIYVFLSPFVYRYLTKSFAPPSTVSLISLFGYTLLLMVPIAIVRLIIGRMLNIIASIAGGALCGYSIFIKLSAFYNEENSKKKIIPINAIFSLVTLLVVMLSEYLCFK